MGPSDHDKFTHDLLGVDPAGFAPAAAGAAADDDVDPPPPNTADVLPPPGPATPPPEPATADTPPPSPERQAWAAGRGTLDTAAKQIKALEIWGVAAAADFKKRLGATETDAAAGKEAQALKDLNALAAEVKAEFDKQRMPKAPTADEATARKDAAKKVTSTAGHGTAADSALVVDQLAKMPKELLDILDKNGTKVKVCQGSVTDYLTDLKGVQPRGWPAGSTWDSVPGLQRPASKEVVIATVGQAAGNAHVPATGEGHGSVNLVIHETAHGVDYAANPHTSAGAPFNAARTPDVGALSAYETQPGNAGQEETFAESCARYYSGTPSSAENTPHLHKYWRGNPLAPAAPGAAAPGGDAGP